MKLKKSMENCHKVGEKDWYIDHKYINNPHIIRM